MMKSLMYRFIIIFIVILPLLVSCAGNNQSSKEQTFKGINLSNYSDKAVLQKQLAILQREGSQSERFRAFYTIARNHWQQYSKMYLTDRQAVEIYTAALNDENVVIQTLAADKLGGGGFVNNLPSDYVRQKVVELLISLMLDRRNEKKEISFVIGGDMVFGSDSKRLRKTIAETLGEIGGKRAINPLTEVLKYEELRLVAIESLGKLARDEALLGFLQKHSFIAIAKSLKSHDRQVLVEAARTLRDIDQRQAFKVVERMLKDKDPNLRGNAAISMGLFDSKAAREVMLAALQDKDPKVRANAIFSLSHPNYDKDKHFVDIVLPLLKDKAPRVRGGAAYSLSSVEDKRVVENVLHLLRDSNPGVRANAVHTIGRSGDKKVFEQVVALLNDEDRNVRYQTLSALAAFGDPRAIEPIKTLIGKYPDIKDSASGVMEQLETKK